MGIRSTEDAPSRPVLRRIATAAAALTAAAGATVFVGAPAAYAASGSTCVDHTSGATVHFLVDFSTPTAMISGMTISGFDTSSCDGLPVTVVISGNSAGDPTASPTETLATLDSALSPCSAAPASTISGGAITLHGCAGITDPTKAAYASVHDATQLAVTVSGAVAAVQIGAPTTPRSSPSTGSLGVGAVSTHRSGPSSAASGGTGSGVGGQSGGVLASTGARIALLLGIALLLIAVGLAVLIPARRRNRHG